MALNDSQERYLRGMYRRYRRRFPDHPRGNALEYAFNGFRNWILRLAGRDPGEDLLRAARRFLETLTGSE